MPFQHVPFSCKREAYPSNFSPFIYFAGIVWTRSKAAAPPQQPFKRGTPFWIPCIFETFAVSDDINALSYTV